VNNVSIALLATLMVIHYGWNIKGQMGGGMYLSPIEWPYLIRPFAGERWVVLLPAAGIIVLLILLSFKLSAERDVGAGFIPERTGRSTARPGFKSSLALAWRTQKGLFFSWLIFFTLIGLALGSVATVMADITSTNPSFAAFVRSLGGPERAFMVLVIYVLGVTISLYPVLAIQRLRSEESALRAEVMLALPVSRLRFAVSHLLIAIAGAAAILTAMGLAIGVGGILATGDPGQFSWMFGAAVVKIPAAWVMAGIAVLMFGLVPRAMAGFSYALFGVFILLEFFWEQQVVSDAVYMLSPFAHVYPTNEITAGTITGLTLASVALTLLGLLAFRKRDIVSE
jgi:ABC-2 type transport system permease protein